MRHSFVSHAVALPNRDREGVGAFADCFFCQPRILPPQPVKEDCIEVTGTIVEKFPSGLFSVQLDQERTVLAHLAGKLRRNRIRVLAGDRVTLELSPYDLTKGRITYRHK